MKEEKDRVQLIVKRHLERNKNAEMLKKAGFWNKNPGVYQIVGDLLYEVNKTLRPQLMVSGSRVHDLDHDTRVAVCLSSVINLMSQKRVPKSLVKQVTELDEAVGKGALKNFYAAHKRELDDLNIPVTGSYYDLYNYLRSNRRSELLTKLHKEWLHLHEAEYLQAEVWVDFSQASRGYVSVESRWIGNGTYLTKIGLNKTYRYQNHTIEYKHKGLDKFKQVLKSHLDKAVKALLS